MVGLSLSGVVGLMSANPRLAAQASCERMRGQITESQPWSNNTRSLDLFGQE